MLRKETWQILCGASFHSVQGLFGNQMEEKVKVTGAVRVLVFLYKELASQA